MASSQRSNAQSPNVGASRVRWREEGERLQQLGVRGVVWPEMEAGLEALRHSLYRYRTNRREVEALVGRLRSLLRFGGALDDDTAPWVGDLDRVEPSDEPR